MLRIVTAYEFELVDTGHGTSVVVLSGELDLTNVPDVERLLRGVVDDGGGLVLDLNGVTFLDSAALHMLFRMAGRLGDARRLGIVLEPTAVVARTLAIVGLEDVANVRASVDNLVVDAPS